LSDMLTMVSSLLAAHAGTFILFALAPISASLLLDGLVAAFRGKGLVPLLVAAALTLGAVMLGFLMRQYGLSGLEDSPTRESDTAGLERNAALYLTFSIPLAILAAAIRIGRAALSRR